MRTDRRPVATTRVVVATAWVLASWLVIGCAVDPAPRPSPTPLPSPTPTISGTPTAAPADALAGPPAASLAAEGGDPVAGELGTYLWLDGGSDAPWLTGAPIQVGSGEPLAVSLVPSVPIETWRARYVPAPASGPDGAVSLGSGVGDVRFDAPGVGRWTVEVLIGFGDGLGSASYFWLVEVLQ